ncbi:SAM-dependent methyltransferase [Candidatus Falkowbacteria bacterium CG10_big_fil_rev_8_21_14_0_10_43_11]|uniref:SAM-dependent methyltransferase n=1 Tax=Candidatus Falkowbacteria bacterium CG10_big_fil_rev_8_21_14_0_10_43_11 TaxID=1974568 RepID=A0A2M6WM32_9BACT|nr:MAG: SAM-dependent methyltransferase [Candidatus Falkowbacteria bacterium CG10_big_fil_rev_8_21_14_0_10_43_11]
MFWLLLLFAIIFSSLFSLAFAGFSFAPWVPCWSKDLARIFKAADLKNGEIFYDLGCGNGKTVLYAAKNFKIKAVGLELALPLYFICQCRRFFNGTKNAEFKWKNLFKEDLASADAVYFFGMPQPIHKRLKEKLERELKPGARVISYVFPVPGWTPDAIDKPTNSDAAVYLYRRG